MPPGNRRPGAPRRAPPEPGADVAAAAEFYARRLGDADTILRLLARSGKALEHLEPADLLDEPAGLDHQHHGGPAATEALARWAGIRAGMAVLDVGAGLGGPARLLAWRLGCRLVGLEPVASRCADAQRLTVAVGMDDRVQMVRGDAAALPFRDAGFGACLSQEALFHVADKRAALAECRRVLAPGGVLALSDWVATPRLTGADRARLERECAAGTLAAVETYRRLLAEVGFEGVVAEDLSEDWRAEQRRAHGNLRRGLAEQRGTVDAQTFEAFERRARQGEVILELIDARRLGGARFRAVRGRAG